MAVKSRIRLCAMSGTQPWQLACPTARQNIDLLWQWYYDHAKFGGGGKVMKLKRALYGIAHAPRRWFERLVTLFIKHGLKPTVVDPCLFVLRGP